MATYTEDELKNKGVEVGGMLYVETTDGVAVLAGQVYDTAQGKDQATINAELASAVGNGAGITLGTGLEASEDSDGKKIWSVCLSDTGAVGYSGNALDVKISTAADGKLGKDGNGCLYVDSFGGYSSAELASKIADLESKIAALTSSAGNALYVGSADTSLTTAV